MLKNGRIHGTFTDQAQDVGMKGMTPLEKLESTKTLIHSHILLFPTLFLNKVFATSYDSVTGFLKRGGKYVYIKCEFFKTTHTEKMDFG